MPNKKDVRNPRNEFMLKEFEDIVRGQMQLPGGNIYGFVSELNDLQKDIRFLFGYSGMGCKGDLSRIKAGRFMGQLHVFNLNLVF